MKNLTAKELEEKFSLKQLAAYNSKLKQDYINLNSIYKNNLKYQEARIIKEVEQRSKVVYAEANKENRKLENQLRMVEDYNRRLEKKNIKMEETVKKIKEEGKIRETELLKEIEKLKSEIKEKNSSTEELLKKIEILEKKIEQYQMYLNNDGTTTSIPTSQTPINKKKIIPNTRKISGKSKGGQIGHSKNKLSAFKQEEVTKVIKETLRTCTQCNSKKLIETGKVIYKDEYAYRIIVDKIRHEYIEYQCSCCGKIIHKEIPVNLKEENQYGSSIQSLSLGMMNIGNVPINKIKRLIYGLTIGEVDLSEGYISKLQKRASKKLETFVEDLKKQIILLKQLYWDDTVIMIDTKRACMRFYGNEQLAFYTAHLKKNKKGVDKDNILNLLNKEQKVMHDHNKLNYNEEYDFMNVECNAHLLRDLEKVSKNIPSRTWSKKLKEHIQRYEHLRKEKQEKNIDSFTEEETNEYFLKFDEYVLLGFEENKNDSKPYYSKTERTLLDRIVEYRDNYTFWVLDFGIAFTNNLSERGLRGVKSKMKVSGQFQNIENAEYYANIRSYIETCHRNGINEMDALQRLMENKPYTVDEILSYEKN